jgi:hypothetical protein
VQNLPALRPNQVYACWYNEPGTNKWITAGSIRGSGNFVMTSAADPLVFTVMKIIVQQSGNPRPTGKVVLTGTARP